MIAMYYGECSPARARAVIRDIVTRIDGDFTALIVVKQFMNNELTTDNVIELINGEGPSS